MRARIDAYETNGAWVREAAMAYAEKQSKKNISKVA
jgi:ring-1,2-phenylacetyl-CoA epoxidase subunit PaaA